MFIRLEILEVFIPTDYSIKVESNYVVLIDLGKLSLGAFTTSS